MKRPGQREVNRRALEAAAAIIDCEDFDSLFGTEFTDEWGNDDVMDDRMHKAHQNAVQRIKNLIKGQ